METTQLMDKNLRKYMNSKGQETIPEYAKTGIDMANFFFITQKRFYPTLNTFYRIPIVLKRKFFIQNL